MIASLMPVEEARRTVEAINHHLTSARALLLDLYQREGWRSLGYRSWRECVGAEFGDSERHLYRQLNAAEIEVILANPAENCPIGQIPEAQLRPLTPFKGNPEMVREIWQEAVETEPPGGLTSAHVERTAQRYKAAATPAIAVTVEAEVERSPVIQVPAALPVRSKLAVHHSSESSEHYSPKRVVQAAIACLGAIDLDPCSNSHHSPNVPAANHYVQADDGLSQPWWGRVYLNPPYGSVIGEWTERLCREYEAGTVEAAIALVPSRTDTQWFRRLRDYPRCFVAGRLTFVGNTDAAPFPSAIFYLGREFSRFCREFSDLGDIYQRVEN